MLRRLSTLSVCFLLLALFAPTAEAQRTFHIGDLNHVGINDVDPTDPSVYYYDSLEHLWADIPVVYTIDQGQDSINFILYADQEIYNTHMANSFFSIESSIAAARQIRFTSSDGQELKIGPADGLISDTDFLRSASQYTHLTIAPGFTITAGSNNDITSDRSATSVGTIVDMGGYIYRYGGGANLTAAGVTYLSGGPVTVDYNYGSINRTGTSYDVHSTINLEGASFLYNSYNARSDEAVLYLKDVASGVNLTDSTFIDNNGWGLRVFIDDAHYRATANITVNLGGSEGNQTIFQGNGDWAWIDNPDYDPADPESSELIRVRQDSGPGKAIIVGGSHYSGTSQATITLNFSGAGDVFLYDNMYGEATAESGGNYRTRITMSNGTLHLGESTVHQFNGTSQGTLGTGNRSNVWTHSGGTMEMGVDSRIELTEDFDQFIFSGGSIILLGDSDPGNISSATGNYIEAHTINFQGRSTFYISGDLINQLTPANKAVLTLNANTLTQPTNGSLIDFDISGLRGSITNKVLVHNEGSGTFSNAAGNQPTGSPHYGRTYRALIDGNDVTLTHRISATVGIANAGKDLVLNVVLDNKVVTAVRLTGGTGSLNWNVANTVNWKYEDPSPTGTTTQEDMIRTAFIPNDAVVFNDFGKEGLTFNIMNDGVYVSQQTGYLSQNTPIDPFLEPSEYLFKQVPVIEYGMRVSGIHDWTFNGGSINDDYDPLQTFHEEQINHVGRLTFEGIGRLNLFNSNPNVYHDGTVVGNRGYDPDSITNGGHFDPEALGYNPDNPVFDINKNTVMNVYGPGSMGSGKYVGEIALVDSDFDGEKNDQYVIQEDGFGLKFIGYGGTVNILYNTNYASLETDRLFDQRIRVVDAGGDTVVDTIPVGDPDLDPYDSTNWTFRNDVSTTGIIRMANRYTVPDEDDPDAEGELIHVYVTASDAYWVNHGNLTGENVDNNGEIVNTLNSGGTIFIDPNTSFEMTGYFDFTENKILRSYEGTQITSLDVDRFDGGVLWVGYGASVNMTDASFIGNGYFYDRDLTQENPEDQYVRNGQVRHGGAIYFTGGINAFTEETATLTLSASSSAEKTNVASNAAGVGGAIYVAQGAGAVINIKDVVFTNNVAVLAGANYGGGALYIKNDPVDGELINVVLNASGSEYHNNIAYGAPGGAIRLFQGNTVDLDGSTFSYNGVVRTAEEGVEIDPNKIVTTFGGAIYVDHSSSISIRDARFNSNAATGDGGAIYGTGVIFSGDRSRFEGNVAGQRGGAIYIASFANAPLVPGGSHVSLANSIFSGNSAGGNGGAIYFNPGDFTLNIASAQFIGNKTGKVDALGGAIYAGGDSITINGNNAVFDSNMIGADRKGLGQYGGAIYLGNEGSLFMNNAQFRSNEVTHSQGQGGAVYTRSGATLDFTGASFSDNVASLEGGAVYTVNGVNDTGTLTINGTGFSRNISKAASGGAVFAVNMIVTGDEASFVMNEAATDGGALHLISQHAGEHETKTIELNYSNFDMNKANGGVGGAVFLDFSDAIFNAEGSQFLSNTATGHGGAIHAIDHTVLNVGGSTFGISARGTETGNESLTGSGGAIYLDGRDRGFLEATSKLNAGKASFIGNVAKIDGGAVYLLYADADISEARFENNRAEDGRGGGLFYENENAKELIVESAVFTGNTATTGGAVYTVNETFIHAKNTSLSYNQATEGDGGAVYFASENSQLDISKSTVSDAIIERNVAFGDGGAIRMQRNSKLIANNAVFFNNTAGGSGGAFRIDGDVSVALIADIQASGASFANNAATAGDGGAIYLHDESLSGYGATLNRLLLNGSTFNNNTAGKNGGAVHASNTDLNVASSSFNGNVAGVDGGAIYLLNSDLNAWGSNFINNKAGNPGGNTGKGGAIYFLTTNNHDRTIYLGADTGKRAIFDNNTMGLNVSNSIYFETGVAYTSYVTLEVATEGNGILSMRDAMAVDSVGNLLDLDIEKSGTGTWELGGNNDFGITRVGTTVDVKEGTFALLPGATLTLTNTDAQDYFKLYRGAAFRAGGDSNSSGPARLETTNLDFAVGTTMQLDAELILNIENDYAIASILSGNGGFVKEDAQWLTFLGVTNNFNGDVSIKQGRFSIAKSNAVAGSGHFETTNGHFYMGTGTHLYVTVDPDQPALTAKKVTIDSVNLHVAGISGTYGEKFVLIHTTDGIVGNFNGVSADGNLASDVDYLTFNLGFMNGGKDYGGTIDLRWYSSANNIPAWGNFTLVEEDDYFNVAVELVDNHTNLSLDWNGTTLDKYGLGTLELSAQNRYTGATTVHAGELYLTDASGTGVGVAKVEVKDGARLGLNFTGLYEKAIWGGGQVVIRGGTVELGGENEYTGGTVLKNGILEFSKGENLGTGTITFEGGTLRNKAEATLNQSIAIGPGSTANFDIPLYSVDSSKPSLTVNGVIYGNGGLEKTGKGILALGGNNTYTGTSYIREGGIKIDGSVAGDVRVSQYASVGGKGAIGGDLFLSPQAYYDWFFTPDRNESAPLHVAGSVNLADGAIFRPRTDNTDFSDTIVGWTVLSYDGALGGEFTSIDDTFNAFYSFELDYSTPGEIRVAGELMSRPRALGDIVATSLAIANKKLYRNSFGQLARETAFQKTNRHHGVRGQAFQPTRSIWFTPMARSNDFGTNYVGGNYDFEAYGTQVGSTLWSNNTTTLGLMFGYERGNLRNRLDQIRSHDYYLGLYYGHLFGDGYELRAFIGGGFQEYTMFRTDTIEKYKATYDGSSFEMNFEFGKLFAGQNGTLLRPYLAADIEHGSISSGQENAVGNAYRHYGKADLSQFFFRLGLDLEKRWRYVDWNGGLSYSCLLAGKRRAQADIFYPVRGAGTTSYSARLGRSSMTLKTGLNWHLDQVQSNTFFIDYFADIYMDRAGDGVQHTATMGYRIRF